MKAAANGAVCILFFFFFFLKEKKRKEKWYITSQNIVPNTKFGHFKMLNHLKTKTCSVKYVVKSRAECTDKAIQINEHVYA